MRIKFQKFRFNSFKENTYVIWDEESKETIILDPGCSNEMEQTTLSSFISEQNLIPTKIINTHCHVDHILGNAFCKKMYQIPLLIHKDEVPVLALAPTDYPGYHFDKYEHIIQDNFLEDTLFLNDIQFDIWYLPGHSPGHIALLNKEEKKCFTGDVLFNSHIGITNFHFGDKNAMKKSLNKLMKLDDDVEIFPGHGFSSTIAHERDTVKNYILQE